MTKRLNLNMADQEYNELKRAATQEGASLSEWVRVVLGQYVEKGTVARTSTAKLLLKDSADAAPKAAKRKTAKRAKRK